MKLSNFWLSSITFKLHVACFNTVCLFLCLFCGLLLAFKTKALLWLVEIVSIHVLTKSSITYIISNCKNSELWENVKNDISKGEVESNNRQEFNINEIKWTLRFVTDFTDWSESDRLRKTLMILAPWMIVWPKGFLAEKDKYLIRTLRCSVNKKAW